MVNHTIPRSIALICVGIVLITSSVSAQLTSSPSGIDGVKLRLEFRTGTSLFWATHDLMLKEMGVDQATRQKLKEVGNSWIEESRQIEQETATLKASSAIERKQKGDELTRRRAVLNLQTSKTIYGLLTEQQIDRLHGTFLQHYGVEALIRTDVKLWLNLSDTQTKQLGDLETAYRNGQNELQKWSREQSAKGLEDIPEENRRWTALRDERERKGLEILTVDQREKLKKAKGAPFQWPHSP